MDDDGRALMHCLGMPFLACTYVHILWITPLITEATNNSFLPGLHTSSSSSSSSSSTAAMSSMNLFRFGRRLDAASSSSSSSSSSCKCMPQHVWLDLESGQTSNTSIEKQ